jgi:hypothetical protein
MNSDEYFAKVTAVLEKQLETVEKTTDVARSVTPKEHEWIALYFEAIIGAILFHASTVAAFDKQ